MRKVVGIVALAVALAVVAPAAGDTVVNECSTTSAATVSPILGDTAPVCTFNITCTGLSFGCIYVFTLDSNGTGLVEGTVSAEVVSPNGTATWRNISTGEEAPDPSCSGLFQCHDGTSEENPVALFITDVTGDGALVRITCTGGGISALETVNCNLVNIEFEFPDGPRELK